MMSNKPNRPLMRTLKRLTAMLLILALPVYAWAALGVTWVCPMDAVPMAGMTGAGHACCDVAKASAESAQDRSDKAHPCKPGQECKAGSLYEPQLSRTGESPVAADGVIATPESPVLSRDPTGVWRPPPSL